MMVTPFDPQKDCYSPNTEPLSASVTNITIQGEEGIDENGNPSFSNLVYGVNMGGSQVPGIPPEDCVYFTKQAQGDFQFSHNTGSLTSYFMIDFWASSNSHMTAKDNFIDAVGDGIRMEEDSNSILEIANNNIDHAYGNAIHILAGGYSHAPFLRPSVYNIVDNDVSAYEEANAITVWDIDNLGNLPYYGPNKTVILRARNNNLTLYPSNVFGLWLEGVDGGMVTNNEVTGSSNFALVAGMWGLTRNVLVTGINLSQYTNLTSTYKILLDWGTEHYVVTGVPRDQVLDNGTDNVICGTHSSAKGGVPNSLLPQLQLKKQLEKVKGLIQGAH